MVSAPPPPPPPFRCCEDQEPFRVGCALAVGHDISYLKRNRRLQRTPTPGLRLCTHPGGNSRSPDLMSTKFVPNSNPITVFWAGEACVLWNESAPPTARRRPLQMTRRHLTALPTAGTHPEPPSWATHMHLPQPPRPYQLPPACFVRGRARVWMWQCVGVTAIWRVHALSRVPL